MFVLRKDKENSLIYSTFMEDLSTYLLKLPNSDVKRQVQNLINKNLIFLAVSKVKTDNLFVRLLLTTENKLAGVVLDTQQLKIDPTNGSAESIDECVYAVYFGLVRAAVIINKDKIRQDKDLHKLLSTYLYSLMIKAVGVDKIFSQKAKMFIHILSIYIYYKYYLKEKHSYILSIIKRDYSNFIDSNVVEEFLPTLDEMESYNSIKDFPKMLIDAKLWNENPRIFIISLIKILKPFGFYCLMGPLDYLVSLVIVSRYPTDFFSKKSVVNDKIQSAVEEIIVGYMDKINYDINAVLKG